MNQLITSNQPLTMNSAELAELIGMERKEVNRKIRDMFAPEIEGGIISPAFRPNGQVEYYMLPEVESTMFVGKWHTPFLRALSEYWVARKGSQPKWMMQLSPEARIAIEDLSKQVEVKDHEIERLQGVCNTVTAQFAPGLTISTMCKQFNGVNIMQVNNKLIKMGMLIKTKHGYEPSSYARDNYFTVSYESFEKPNGDESKRSTVTLTLKGAKWLYKAYLSNKLPMKKSWDGSLVHVEFEVKQG